jgi:hypothetical protein
MSTAPIGTSKLSVSCQAIAVPAGNHTNRCLAA